MLAQYWLNVCSTEYCWQYVVIFIVCWDKYNKLKKDTDVAFAAFVLLRLSVPLAAYYLLTVLSHPRYYTSTQEWGLKFHFFNTYTQFQKCLVGKLLFLHYFINPVASWDVATFVQSVGSSEIWSSGSVSAWLGEWGVPMCCSVGSQDLVTKYRTLI